MKKHYSHSTNSRSVKVLLTLAKKQFACLTVYWTGSNTRCRKKNRKYNVRTHM